MPEKIGFLVGLLLPTSFMVGASLLALLFYALMADTRLLPIVGLIYCLDVLWRLYTVVVGYMTVRRHLKMHEKQRRLNIER